MTQGWKPPANSFELQWQFLGKHGDDSYNRSVDRKWRILGKLIEKGSRIVDGRLG